jgi:hypothetical protein
MKLRILALSTVLLFSAGVLAWNNAPSPTQDGTAATTATQPPDPNGRAVQSTPSQTTPTNNRSVNRSIETAYGRTGGGWGWWGIIGLFGLFGLMGRGKSV